MARNSKNVPYELRRPGGEFNTKRVFNVPGVILLILIANILVFATLVFLPLKTANELALIGAVTPKRFLAGAAANGGWLSMISPLISHQFLHAGLLHLGMNSLWLLALGAPVARRMKTDNALQSISALARAGIFLTFYLLCGIAGALTFIGLNADTIIPMVGASGAVSGLMGGLVRFAFNRSTLFGPEHASISPLSSQSVYTWAFFVVAMNVAVGVFGFMSGGALIAWEAHVGGFLFGMLAYPLFERLALAWR